MLAQSSLASTPLPKRDRLSSIPTPFITESLNYSFRRDRVESESTPEPSKPIHRNSTVSRITSKRSIFSGPNVLGGIDRTSFLSTPGYSGKTPQTYLQQCFQTLQILGEGSFGKVFKCRDKASGIDYAVKVSECYNSRALEEVRKHEALSKHPNCVQFVKAWEERKCLHIQMELCDESLQNYCRRINDRLPETELWRILHHCLSGLSYLHSNQLVHMDVKPDNIFRFRTENATTYKLGDFGLSVSMADLLDKTDIIEGDSKYLAPELLDRQCDAKADIFSLGISILEIMADLDLPNNGELWHALRNGDLPLTPGYSQTLRGVVTTMLNKDPTRRPRAAEILTNQSVKCYSWVNFFRDWSDYLKSKSSSVVNYIWRKDGNQGSGGKRGEDSDDLFDGMEDLDDDQDLGNPCRDQNMVTPREFSKIASPIPRVTPQELSRHMSPVVTPREFSARKPPVAPPGLSPRVHANLSFTHNSSPRDWPGSPSLSPVNSASRNFTDNFESSTPNKFQIDDSDSEEYDTKPSFIQRNLLDSFADNEDDDDIY